MEKYVVCEKCGALVKVLIDCTCKNCGEDLQCFFSEVAGIGSAGIHGLADGIRNVVVFHWTNPLVFSVMTV